MAEPAASATTQASRLEQEARLRLRANRRDGAAYRLLGRALRQLGRNEEASEAELAAIDASQFDPEIARAADAIAATDIQQAELILRSVLARRPDDVAAIGMLGEIAIRTGHPNDAERLLRHALSLAPDFAYARFTLAVALDMLSRPVEVLDELKRISGPLAERDETMALKAASLKNIGANEDALRFYRELARRHPQKLEFLFSIGTLQRILGDQAGAVDAYRKALDVAPANGEAWWALASIATFRFANADVEVMERALASQELPEGDRAQIHFALGKAFEDRREDERSFGHYHEGNAIRSMRSHYDPAASTALVDQAERLFTPEFFKERSGFGSDSRDPIFIVGLTRSGSTLIEQILASHSEVEGTGELPDLIVLAKELEQSRPGTAGGGWRNYPDVLADLSASDFARLGQSYLERTRLQRKTDRPFFTDKMPNNWFHLGLVRLMLPNAKIIDARRHPLACGWSNFRQHYSRGQEFTYDLKHFGRHYRDYVRFMAQFDRACPGKIHRVIHERLLTEPETEIRRLLDFLGLPFEDACLRFYETERPVRTISAEQVRRPIDAGAVDTWKRFETWLAPLKDGLGDTLEHWAE